jgi:hypothetical protein
MWNSIYRTGCSAQGFALSARALQYLSSLQRMSLGAKACRLKGLCATRAQLLLYLGSTY